MTRYVKWKLYWSGSIHIYMCVMYFMWFLWFYKYSHLINITCRFTSVSFLTIIHDLFTLSSWREAGDIYYIIHRRISRLFNTYPTLIFHHKKKKNNDKIDDDEDDDEWLRQYDDAMTTNRRSYNDDIDEE